MKKTAIALAAIGSLATGALFATAEAQMQQPEMDAGAAPGTICGERLEMVKALNEQFREEPQAVGQVDANAVIEVFVSQAGTWTILATGTDGKSCLVASGEGWNSQQMVIGVGA
ncbi:MAG: hypothetical protein KF849_16510 [Rhizobiaceae bacterium]|nr:hypothetical protein [Rhizobiaceae bacterium]